MRLGWLELVLILGVVLLFFGPKRLPGLAKALGSSIRDFKRGIGGGEETQASAEDKSLPTSTSTSSEPQSKA